jgi:hypothetical protein
MCDVIPGLPAQVSSRQVDAIPIVFKCCTVTSSKRQATSTATTSTTTNGSSPSRYRCSTAILNSQLCSLQLFTSTVVCFLMLYKVRERAKINEGKYAARWHGTYLNTVYMIINDNNL